MRADSLTEFDQILAGHFVIDAAAHTSASPSRASIAACTGRRSPASRRARRYRDRARRSCPPPRRARCGTCMTTPVSRMDRQERRIGRRPLLAQRRQHDLPAPRRSAPAYAAAPRRNGRIVIVRRRREFVVETEADRESRAAAHYCARRNCRAFRTDRGSRVSGLPRCAAISSLLGTLSGTLRSPSMSSEKAISRVAICLRSAP